MKGIMLCGLLSVLFLQTMQAQKVLPNTEINKRIAAWYEAHPNEYKIVLDKNMAEAKITGYYENTGDLIRVNYKGMVLTFAFRKNIKDISTHADSLKKYFNYGVADHIFMEIDAPHWDVHPGTSVSSYSEGVTFLDKGSGRFAVAVKWDIYGVMGYKQDEWCKDKMNIMDAPTPEACMAHVRKKIDFYLEVDVPIEKVEAPIKKEYPQHLRVLQSTDLKGDEQFLAMTASGKMVWADDKARKLSLKNEKNELLWEVKVAAEQEYHFSTAYEHNNGDIYVGGYEIIGETVYYTLSLWDAKGVFQWKKQWYKRPEGYHNITDILVDAKGNIFVLGDGFFVFDAQGNKKKEHLFQAYNEEHYKILPYKKDEYAVIGYSASVSIRKGSSDMILYTFSQDGKLLDMYCYGGGGIDEAEAALVDKKGNLVLAGQAGSKDGDVKGLKGDNNIWVIKLNQKEEIDWQICLGSSNVARFTPFKVVCNVLEMENGNILVIGHNTDDDIDVESFGDVDGLVACLSKNGTLLWQQSIGSVDFDRIKGAYYKKGVLSLVTNHHWQQYKVE